MKIISSLCFFVVVFISFESCYKEEIVFDALPNNQLELALILELNDKACFLDRSSKTLRYSIAEDSIQNFSPYVRFQEDSEIRVKNIALINQATNHLGKIKINEKYPVQITTKGVKHNFTLVFTNLPIVRVVTPNQIIDEPQKLARFTINYPSDTSPKMTAFVGIDFRGGAAQFNVKKSYGFSFLNTMDLSNKTSKALFDWKKNEDWILDAMYNDKARLRNKISFEIWKAMNPSKHKAIQARLVELYINNDYQGLYSLNEQMNAEQLELSGSEAVLYKSTGWGEGATIFEHLSSNAPLFIDVWEGWEQKYPNPKDKINWQPLYDLRDMVVNKSDAEFIAQIGTQIDLELLIDYYIFLNVVAGSDNYGKNIIWVRKNAQSPFFITPWDVDGSWGRFWDGARMNSDVILSNQLFERLLLLTPDNFKHKLKSRWLALRANVLRFSNIEAFYEEAFDNMKKSDILAIEQLKWGAVIDVQQEKNYIDNWLQDRLLFLDVHFANL